MRMPHAARLAATHVRCPAWGAPRAQCSCAARPRRSAAPQQWCLEKQGRCRQRGCPAARRPPPAAPAPGAQSRELRRRGARACAAARRRPPQHRWCQHPRGARAAAPAPACPLRSRCRHAGRPRCDLAAAPRRPPGGRHRSGSSMRARAPPCCLCAARRSRPAAARLQACCCPPPPSCQPGAAEARQLRARARAGSRSGWGPAPWRDAARATATPGTPAAAAAAASRRTRRARRTTGAPTRAPRRLAPPRSCTGESRGPSAARMQGSLRAAAAMPRHGARPFAQHSKQLAQQSRGARRRLAARPAAVGFCQSQRARRTGSSAARGAGPGNAIMRGPAPLEWRKPRAAGPAARHQQPRRVQGRRQQRNQRRPRPPPRRLRRLRQAAGSTAPTASLAPCPGPAAQSRPRWRQARRCETCAGAGALRARARRRRQSPLEVVPAPLRPYAVGVRRGEGES
jgi:hypothetical protein